MTDTDFPWGIRPANHFQVGDYAVVGEDGYAYTSGDIVQVTEVDEDGSPLGGWSDYGIKSPLRILTPYELKQLPNDAVVKHVRNFGRHKAWDLVTGNDVWHHVHLTYALVSLPPLPEPEPEPEPVKVTGIMSPASLVQSIEKDLAFLKHLLEVGTKKEANDE